MRIIFFDTETTGNGEEDRLCQLAAKERGASESIVNALYKPPRAIPPEAMEVHHITEKMVADKPAFQEAEEYTTLKALFEDSSTLPVAHNAAFDTAMLEREGVTPKYSICTYKVAHALDEDDTLPNYRLQYLRYALGLEVNATAHDAMGDVLVLEALFERLLEKMKHLHNGENAALQEMQTISSRPLLFTTFHFGKYNGKRIEDVAQTDAGYLQWLLGQKQQSPEAESDWIYTLQYHLSRQ